jgi:hypothetical protein
MPSSFPDPGYAAPDAPAFLDPTSERQTLDDTPRSLIRLVRIQRR